MSDQWMYRAFGQEFGPLSFDELKELAACGTLTADSEVRIASSDQWRLAFKIEGLGVDVGTSIASRNRESGGSQAEFATTRDDWYYNIGGLELGPVSFDELMEMARSEQVAADDNVKLGLDGKWRRAGSIGRLMAVLPFQSANTRLIAPEVVETRISDPFADLEDAASENSAERLPLDSSSIGGSQESSHDRQPTTVDPQIEYEIAFAKAKENIRAAMMAQADAAFQTAESQARQEVAWVFGPNVDRQWWGWMGSVQFGPVEFPQVLALARNGQIKPSDFIRNGPFGQFVPASSVPGLMSAVAILTRATEAMALAKAQANAAVELTVAPAIAPSSGPPRLAPPEPMTQSPAPVPRREPGPRLQQSAAPESAAPENGAERLPGAVDQGALPADHRIAPAVRDPLQQTRSSPSHVVPAPSADLDAAVLDRVREALDSKNVPSFRRLELAFDQGVVIVRGNVSSEGERLLAVRVIAQTSGVDRVEDMLTVFNPQAAARPAPRSVPAHLPTVNRRTGPSLFSSLLSGVQGQYRNPVIGALIAMSLVGAFLIPRGPHRPVAVYPVKGRVVMNGEPLANATIVLHSTGKSTKAKKVPVNVRPHAKAEADGSFVLATFDKADGAPEGEFVATIYLNEETIVDGETQLGPNKLPAVYSKPETSPIRIKITSSTKVLQPLELTMQ